jgi:hypothetical protein
MAGSTRRVTPERVRTVEGSPTGVRSKFRAYMTGAARYEPATGAWSPSEYRGMDTSRSHAASQARATGNTTPPMSAAASSHDSIAPRNRSAGRRAAASGTAPPWQLRGDKPILVRAIRCACGPESTWSFKEFQGVSRSFKEFQGVSRSFKEFQGVSRGQSPWNRSLGVDERPTARLSGARTPC